MKSFETNDQPLLKTVDYDNETTPNIKLLPGERIVNIEDVPFRIPPTKASGLKELYRLTQAKNSRGIGEFGPALASLAIEGNNAETPDSPELHKYEALFGRDSLRVALDVLPQYPKLTRTTLLTLAKLQGTKNDLHREEEPGRIIHEFRKADDPIAQELTNTRGWQWPYYGSVDSTPQFIHTLTRYCANSQTEGVQFLNETYIHENGSERTMKEALSASVEWVIRRLQSNPDGLLEFQPAFTGSTINQAWKDSPDSYFHTDGTIASHKKGVASIEVQCLAHEALLGAAELYEDHLDKKEVATTLRAHAAKIEEVIMREFWIDTEDGYFALGTDRGEDNTLRPLAIRTSNMGHALHSRLLLGDEPEIVSRRESVIKQLFSPEMLNASGIRTLATDEIRFRPGAYHNGSVWLWDTYFIAQGLQRHGYFGLANELTRRISRVVELTNKFPEFVRGDSFNTPTLNTRLIDIWDPAIQDVNRIEQPPQEVQAWSVAAIVAMKHHHGKVPTRATDPSIKKFEDTILNTLN